MSFIQLTVETVTLPNGVTTELEIVRHPGAAAVVPLTDRDTVLLVHQYRHAAGGYLLEVPAGKLDTGEDPAVCAARELEEEAGVRAGALQHLGSIFTTPGFTNEVIHLYLATQLQPGQQSLEADEVLQVVEVPFAEAIDKCVRGEIRDGKSICALLLSELSRRRAVGAA